MTEQQGINIQEYIKNRENGTAKIVKLNGRVYMSVRAFNPADGTPIPELLPLDLAGAEKAAETMEADLAGLRTIIEEIKAAPEKLSA